MQLVAMAGKSNIGEKRL
ncbi:hypothetical protein HaLaN_07868, partial [Haematococcus lacustris]